MLSNGVLHTSLALIADEIQMITCPLLHVIDVTCFRTLTCTSTGLNGCKMLVGFCCYLIAFKIIIRESSGLVFNRFGAFFAHIRYRMVKHGRSTTSSGMAYVNTICQTKQGYSCSVIQETGGFGNAAAAAHELAHRCVTLAHAPGRFYVTRIVPCWLMSPILFCT